MASQTLKELWLRRFGKWVIVSGYSIGTGIITAVAASSLAFLSALALPWLIPILIAIFLAETFVCIYLLKDAVPDTLVDLLLNNPFADLSRPKQILLGLGLFSALGAGVAMGGLTYVATATTIASIFAVMSVAAPPVALILIGSVFALIAFFAATTLLFKWISIAIKKDFHLQILEFFKEIFTRDENKLLAQQILEGTFKLLFTFAIIAITIVGTIATLGSMNKGLMTFLTLIPNANILACKIASAIIAYALMGISRMPWALRSVCVVFSKLGEMVGYGIFRIGSFMAAILDIHALPTAEPLSLETEPLSVQTETQATKTSLTDKIYLVASYIAKFLATLVHGFCLGALAQDGGAEVLSDAMTDLHFPLAPDAIQETGETTAILTGVIMSAALGAAAFFPPPPPSPQPPKTAPDEELQSLTSTPATAVTPSPNKCQW